MMDDQHEFPDELISAYLDDELSPADRKRVEEQLMDSAEHRRLFAELKALRTSLQELPRAELDAGFAERVLRRAEHELLAMPAKESPGPFEQSRDEQGIPADQASLPATLPVSIGRRADDGAWRGLVFSVSALAAAVLLIVFSPWIVDHSEPAVAVVERQQEKIQNAEGASSNRSAKGAQVFQHSRGTVSPAAQGNSQPHPETSQLAAGDSPKARNNSSAQPRPDRALESEPRGGGSLARSFAPAAGGGAEFAPPANPAAPEVRIADRGGDGLAEAAAARETLEADAEAASAAPPQSPAADGDVILIAADLTPEALAGDFFVRMLHKHQIHVDLAQAEEAAGSRNQLALLEKGLPAAAKADFRQARGINEGKAEQLGQNRTDDAAGNLPTVEHGPFQRPEAARKLAAARDVDLLYVVATAEQVEGLLSDLQQQPQHVKALAYNRSPLAQSGGQFGSPESGRARALRSGQFGSLTRRLAPAAEAEEQLPEEASKEFAEGDSLDNNALQPGDHPPAAAPVPPRAAADEKQGDGSGPAAPLRTAGDSLAERQSGGSFAAPFDAPGVSAASPEAHTPRVGAAVGGGAPARDVERGRGDGDAEQWENYRGIARRLHLPMEMLPPPPQAKRHLPAERVDGLQSGDSQAKPRAAQGFDAQGFGPIREQTPKGQFSADDPDASGGPDAGQGAAAAPREGADAPRAKDKSQPAPLIRVLFVLRAAPQAAVAPPAPAAPTGPAQP